MEDLYIKANCFGVGAYLSLSLSVDKYSDIKHFFVGPVDRALTL